MNSDEKIINDIIHLIEIIRADKHEHLRVELREACNKAGIPENLNLSLDEVHMIAFVGRKDITNGISMSENLGLTPGGISKMSSRLVQKGLLTSGRVEGNKREVFYRLTPLGKKVYMVHKELHEKTMENWKNLIQQYSDAQKDIIEDFVDRIAKMI